MSWRWAALLVLALASPMTSAEPAPPASPTPASRIAGAATVSPTAVAQRLRRVIPRPADAVCVEPRSAFDDPISVLQQLMAGRLGPIGRYVASDITGVVNIGGPRQWLFGLGDTLVGSNDGSTVPAGAVWINNAYLVQDDNCFWVAWGRAADGGPRPLVPATGAGGTWYWFADAYVTDGRLYQFLTEGRSTGPGLFDYELLDTDLAIIDLDRWDLDGAEVIETGPWDEIDPQLDGIFNVETGTSEVVLGIVPHDEPTRLYMARPDDPRDPTSTWWWWNGRTWGPATERAAVLDLPRGDNPGVRPFRHGGWWYAMGFTWTTDEVGWFLLRALEMTGPYVQVARSPITPIPGQSADAVQYWHTLEGTYRLGASEVLMQWANLGSHEAGAAVRLARPSFTRFHLDTMTADPVTD